MKKRNISIIVALLMGLSLFFLKNKKNETNDFFKSIDNNDLKIEMFEYHNNNFLEEESVLFEHRCSGLVKSSFLYSLLNENLTELEKEIIKTFINNNSIANNDKFVSMPENTSIGYIVSNRINKCSVEVDIQFTKDNIPVLFHDKDLTRATSSLVNKKVSDFTFEELSKIKIFYGNKNYSYIPSLEEILLLHSIDEYFSILLEVKTGILKEFLNNYKNAYMALKEVLYANEDANRIYLMSGDQIFIYKNYSNFKELGIKTGLTIYNKTVLRELAMLFDKEAYDFISLNLEVINKDLIETSVNYKKALFIGSSTNDNLKKVEKLFTYLQINQNFFIITNYPEKYDNLLNKMEGQKTLSK